ncbi:MAG: DUF4249 family protein [Ignavibacteriales bacterium]|nr:DUF4249 family protein [Ignavibacteriales bacterium]
MKNFVIILLLSLSFFFGCENEELLNPELIYKQKVVVRCQISTEGFFPGVSLTKTLPLGVKYDSSLAEINNATLYLRINGFQIVPLHYAGNGLYKPLYELKALEEEYYELFGEWETYRFYAITKIPAKPIINSVNYNTGGFFAETDISTFKDEVYSALWAVDVGTYEVAKDFYNISDPQNNSQNNSIRIRTAVYPINFQTPIYNGRRYLRVYSFDHSFSDYFKTKDQNEDINNPYVQGSGNTIWNVKGKDVIGMFIGINKSDYIPVN